MADPRKEFIKAAQAGDVPKLRALLASDESLGISPVRYSPAGYVRGSGEPELNVPT